MSQKGRSGLGHEECRWNEMGEVYKQKKKKKEIKKIVKMLTLPTTITTPLAPKFSFWTAVIIDQAAAR